MNVKPGLILTVCLCIGIFQSIVAQNNELELLLKKHVTILAADSMEGRGFALKSKIKSVKYLQKEFEAAGLKAISPNYLHNFSVYNYGMAVEGQNILGLIEGNDPELKHEFLIVGAHYDHLGYYVKEGEKIVFNGADDNASGVAGIIEMARLLSAREENLKRSIVFVAFDGEESGLHGSKALARDTLFDSYNVKAMFSLDMIGKYESNHGLILKGMGLISNGEQLATQIAEKNDLKIKRMNARVEMLTDTRYFVENQIPAVHIFTGLHRDYHKPEDDVEGIDFEGMAKIVEFMTIMVDSLANTDEQQTEFKAISKAKHNRFSFGVFASNGYSIHHFDNTFYNSQPGYSFEGGVAAPIEVSRLFSIQPSAQYEFFNTKAKDGNYKAHRMIAEMSLLATIRSNPDIDSYLYFQGGFCYNANLNVTSNGKELTEGKDYYSNEEDLKLGFGIHAMGVRISFYKKFSLDSNIPDIEVKRYNRSTYFSIGYFF